MLQKRVSASRDYTVNSQCKQNSENREARYFPQKNTQQISRHVLISHDCTLDCTYGMIIKRGNITIGILNIKAAEMNVWPV